MKCPRCDSKLSQKIHKGIEVDSCPDCGGMWLDFEELDELEDKVFDNDGLKGTMIFNTFPSEIKCPKCGIQMRKFNYRLYDLEVDFCEEQHGFWLDKGEEERVLELMKEEVQRMTRKFDIEEKWAKTLRKLKSKSFFSKLKDLFK